MPQLPRGSLPFFTMNRWCPVVPCSEFQFDPTFRVSGRVEKGGGKGRHGKCILLYRIRIASRGYPCVWCSVGWHLVQTLPKIVDSVGMMVAAAMAAMAPSEVNPCRRRCLAEVLSGTARLVS